MSQKRHPADPRLYPRMLESKGGWRYSQVMPLRNTTKFLVSWVRDVGSSIMRTQTTLSTSEGEFPCDIYEHKSRRGRAPTVTFIHGMSLEGNQDARQVKVCEALVMAGFKVYAPHFAEIADLKIKRATVSRIESVIQAVVHLSQEPTSLFSVSFSGGLSLMAASKPSLRDKLKAVCVIGTFSDVSTCLNYLIKSPDADEYGRLIIFRNYLWDFESLYPGLMNLLDAAACDNARPEHPSKLEPALNAAPKLTQAYFHDLVNDPVTRAKAMTHIYRMHGRELQEFNVGQLSHQLNVPITFIHGADDNVIPAQQSKDLFQTLLLQGHDCELVISPILSHGDRQPLSFLALLELGKGFDHFMKRALKPVHQEVAA